MSSVDRIVIGPPGPADQPVVVDLLAAQLAEHQIDTPRAAIAAAIDGMLSDARRGFLLVAKDGDEIVGVAYVGFIWTLEHGGHSAWLEELYVTPERRAHGIGTRLLAASLAIAKSSGCIAVDLDVDRDHARVTALYARHGFRMLPRGRWVKTL